MNKYDVIVIGAGHAGVEAAHAAATLGSSVLLLTISLDSISMMPCNPSIGGTGKGHLVKEIDALGGLMGLVSDEVTLQSKMLNRAKGAAVHSLRVQTDKFKYHTQMKKRLEQVKNLDILQAEVEYILSENRKIKGVRTTTQMEYFADAIILATGTYLAAKIFIGETTVLSGPSGLKGSYDLSDHLREMGIKLRRFKTGTPARIHADSVDYDKIEIQWGDKNPTPFSFLHDEINFEEYPCYLMYTNETTHEIIQNNLHRSGMFTGEIEGVGPRYCPSIESKVVRFSDKNRHQIFLEPEGTDTKEMYVQGMSSSLPESIQVEFLKTIEGLENMKMMRPGYAIEYDCIDPTSLFLSLESKDIEGLFFAGQINGSSGYEEAAAQGLIAGINAHQKIHQKDPFILKRNEAYIGVLIDDLVTKGTDEPFRMMTSRAEYRLILRQDNADLRLTKIGYELGLASKERYEKMLLKQQLIDQEKKRIESTLIDRDSINKLFKELGEAPVKESMYVKDLLRRTSLNYEKLLPVYQSDDIPSYISEAVEIDVKYEGYIQKQLKQIEKFEDLERMKIPNNFDFSKIKGLRLEAMERLVELEPINLGQASRISGVNPADISVLMIAMESLRRKNESK